MLLHEPSHIIHISDGPRNRSASIDAPLPLTPEGEDVLKAVLFDLDGTLLDIDVDEFLRQYFGALGPVIAEVVGNGSDPKSALAAVMAGTEAMQHPHPGQTNQQVFEQRFLAETGTDLAHPRSAEKVDSFYREVFPSLRAERGPRSGSAAALWLARELGLKVAVATNPIFPLTANVERLRWAGFSVEDVEFITSYETSPACKPAPAYFADVAARLGVEPDACLMVGDDRALDMPAAAIGMRTFYVGEPPAPTADWTGTLDDLASLLPRLVD